MLSGAKKSGSASRSIKAAFFAGEPFALADEHPDPD
jgi:hypothetical protein